MKGTTFHSWRHPPQAAAPPEPPRPDPATPPISHQPLHSSDDPPWDTTPSRMALHGCSDWTFLHFMMTDRRTARATWDCNTMDAILSLPGGCLHACLWRRRLFTCLFMEEEGSSAALVCWFVLCG
ncbi:hypothetical protein MATL_G00175740 [Megalops atlanticus]|uniref:Uncharacterized protein n=1 Tax=Megalops atlanticus TaxID=7932 RepID=A0A9D3PU02_MEGAT|nr:hypothetical protein MATL_G00175740 [Megalops atlanticus]